MVTGVPMGTAKTDRLLTVNITTIAETFRLPPNKGVTLLRESFWGVLNPYELLRWVCEASNGLLGLDEALDLNLEHKERDHEDKCKEKRRSGAGTGSKAEIRRDAGPRYSNPLARHAAHVRFLGA